MLQALESRRLFTVDIIGSHYVIASEEQVGNTIVITQEDNGVRVTIDGVKQPTRNTDYFNMIEVHGGPGKDKIFIDKSVQLGCEVYGDGGNDTIECMARLNSRLDGGSGTDTVTFANAVNYVFMTPDNVANDGIASTAGVYDIRSNVEILIGSNYSDHISAGMISNATVYGGSGNDTITGGMKGDVWGGEGDDLFQANETTGSNSYFGGPGKDAVSYIGRLSNLSLTLDATKKDGAANELDYLNGDIEELIGGGGNDTLKGNQGNNKLVGLGGNDVIYDGDGDDIVQGGTGNDTFVQGFGTDKVSGGAGMDAVLYSARTKNLIIKLDGSATSGETAIYEGDKLDSDIEHAIAGKGNDQLYGNNKNNNLYGGEGNDSLDGALGDDILTGNTGNDTVHFEIGRTKGVNVTLDDVANDGSTGEKDNVRSDIENVNGTIFGDTIVGSSKDNNLWGLGGNDLINGQGGDDLIGGYVGKDTMIGGSGIDTVTYISETKDIKVTIGDGDNDGTPGEKDDVDSSVENIIGGSGNDMIFGSSADNKLVGGPGDDVLISNGGSDELLGEAGTDTADFSSRNFDLNITLDGVANDGAAGETSNVVTEKLISGTGNDTLTGDSADNYIEGGKGNDKIDGAAGNDTLRGGDGKDTLIGGAGNDKLYGDGNIDKFDSKDGEKDTLKGGSGTDSILQKDNNDVLESVP